MSLIIYNSNLNVTPAGDSINIFDCVLMIYLFAFYCFVWHLVSCCYRIESIYLEQSGKRKINKPSFNVKMSSKPASTQKNLKQKDKIKTRELSIKACRDKRLPTLNEQAGLSFDNYVRELFLLESLRRIIMSVQDKSGLIAALVMYAQSHSQRSLLDHVICLYKPVDQSVQLDNFISGLIEQSGETETAWIQDLRSCFTDWQRYKHSKVSKSFLNLVNYVVSVGLCDKARLTFKIGNLCLFSPVVLKKQLQATDLCELVVETALGFIEGGWRVYKNKTLSSFFVDEDLFVEFETAYNHIRSIHGFSLTGNLRRHADIDENQYELKLDETISLGTKLLKKFGSTVTFERKFVSDRLDKIHDYRNEFVQVRTRGGLRVSPFGVSLYGDSAVGKSTLNQLTYEAIGKYNSIPVTPDRVATWADNDKYASNIRASTNVIIFDDFGNTSPKFMDFSPCYRLIQCVNNALFTAPMAEVNLKGKVGLHPWIVMITTNVEYLLANVYSQKPESILRRFYHVKVSLKPEFTCDGKIDEKKVFDTFGYVKIPDIWNLSIRSCVVGLSVAVGSDTKHYSLQNVHFEGKEMKDIDVHTYLRWAQVTSAKHYEQQRLLVETMRADNIDLCNKCGFCGCTCPVNAYDTIPIHIDEDFNEHSASVLRFTMRFILACLRFFVSYTLSVFWMTYIRWIVAGFKLFQATGYFPGPSHFVRTFIQQMDMHLQMWCELSGRLVNHLHNKYTEYRIDILLSLSDFYNNHWLFDFVVYLPDNYIHSNVFVIATLYQRRFSIIFRQRFLIGAIIITYLNSIIHLYYGNYWRSVSVFVLANFVIAMVAACERFQLEQELIRRRSVVPGYLQWARNHYVITLVGIMSSIYAALKVWKQVRRLQIQGNLLPNNIEDVLERDKETNPWAELQISEMPLAPKSRTIVCEDLVKLCQRNLVVVESCRYVVRGFFLTSNVLVVPYHYIRLHDEAGMTGDIQVKCFRTGRNIVGANFREVLARTFSVRIPDSDFIAFYCPSSGSSNNLVPYLPLLTPATCDARFVQKNIDEPDIITPILFEAGDVEHTTMKFKGGKYILSYDTFSGMCMSPIVSKGRGSSIVGFHLCGKGRRGGAGTITKSQADLVIGALNSMDGCVVSAAAGTLPKEQYGFPTIQSGEVHYKSASRYITPGNSLEVYGTISGMVTPISNVVSTVISPHVERIMNVPQQWGPPRLTGRHVFPYQTALETLAHPSLSLGSFIRPAVVCYRSVFPEIRNRIPELFRESKPLTQVETVSGIDGKRFIDAMNMKSSPGWPFTGRKDKWIVELNPDDYPHISRPKTFVQKIWDEVDRTSNILLQGERPYFIWKACLKDEPTKLSKTKVRVFQSAPIALQLLIRMYFLPIVRIIQCNPLESECLVGANAEGPEWEQMNNFMLSKGPNILAGDYSKYDQRMPAQLVIAAFDVLIWIARNLCDYSARDIYLMQGIVGEVAFPLMAYNGDLLQLFGSNPSGQNLTVVINSIANVILMRSCYYQLYPQDREECLFRNYCAFATYGDDVKGSVAIERSKFNHLSYAKFLSDFDIVFTMPDKESIATAYMNADEADFLKRVNRYHTDLKINVGVLSEASIFKRLHSHLKSKELSLQMQSAQNIDSSLHDWFYYGRDMFEFRKSQLLEVACSADILHLCRGFDVSYDERVSRWNLKYRGINNEISISSLSLESVFDFGYDMELTGEIPEDFYVCDYSRDWNRF